MLFRIISIIGSMTLVSRILGYARDFLIARVIGAGMISDAFFVAFKLPNLFRRLFAEGSMNSAFIPVVSGVSGRYGKKSANEFFSQVFSLLLVILLILLIVVEIFMPVIINLIAPGFSNNNEKFLLTVDFSRLTFPFVLFVCLTSLMGAYLNILNRFAAMALTPIILNLTMILVLLFFFGYDEKKIYITKSLSFSVSIAGLIQFFWLVYSLKRNNVKIGLKIFNFFEFRKNKNIRKLITLLIPAVIGNGAYQINLLIDMILASGLPDGSISYLYYADRINQLPLGVLGIAISTALLPILSKQIKSEQKTKANESISNALKIGLIFSIPASAGLFVLSNEIVSFLFLRGAFDFSDANLTSTALKALTLGLPAFVMIKILVVPFFANEDTKTPIKISVLTMVLNLILNLILIEKFLHVGLAIATSISAWVNVMLLLFLLISQKKISFDSSILIVLFKVLICSFFMTILVDQLISHGIIYFTEKHFSANKNLSLLITIFFGVIAYMLMIFFSGIKEIKILKWKK